MYLMVNEDDKGLEEPIKNKILDFIEKEGPIEDKEYIERKLDLSSSEVEKYLEELEEEGWIKQDEGRFVVPEKGKTIGVKVSPQLQDTLKSIAQRQNRFLEEMKPVFQVRQEFLDQMRSAAEGVNLRLSGEARKTIQRTHKQIFESLNKAFPAMNEYAEINQSAIEQMTPILNDWQKAINDIKPRIPDLIPTFPDLTQALEEIPDDIREANEKLVPHGWVFSPSMPMDIINFVNENEDVGKIIDELVEDYFTDDTCKRLLDDCLEHHLFEKREEPLLEAFENHKDGRYYSSIPVFLAQADGAYMDTFGDREYLFSKKNDVEKPSDLPFDEALIDGINLLLFEELAADSDDVDDESALNRHVVQHGLWSGYGTKENSVKAIVLLDFARFIIERQEEAEEDGDNEED